ncbi:glycosyltransferase family 2 protein [Formosa sp. 3Alg 14/1]|uniref:glycosyltransferase family 2 protein n=1 Tax=Formosa sp. 3Alg 14/1 TaxID=3382190 RepID=UPI0039BE687F
MASFNINIHRKELFIESNLLSGKQVSEIERFKVKLNKSFLKTALNHGFVSRFHYNKVVEGFKLPTYNINCDTIEEYKSFSDTHERFTLFLDTLIFPIEHNNKTAFVVADPSDINNIRLVEEELNVTVSEIFVTNELDLIKALHIKYGGEILHKSVFHLYENDPNSCAIETFTKKQVIALGVMFLVFLVFLYFNFIDTLIGANLLLNLFLLYSILFKFMLTIYGSKTELESKVSKEEIELIKDKDLPIYTIHLPVFKESEVIQKLVWNLNNLDYPIEKLDAKLLIESDDEMTYNAIREMKFPTNFEPVIIPYAQPKTKPKACNYGLYFSKGKYLTIYDAEDIPDSDQLKQTYKLFQKLPEDYIAIQCALNYFNKNENFLTKMFTLEYSYWFDYMLPGLDNLRIPIPLGGTSNHFKFDKLMELGGWDGFNVTEDADLGLRCYAKDYKITVLNSTTYEEANNDFFNWIRQRSRWIKGYMQTYLVHMRNPVKLYKSIGTRGFFGFQFFIGGTVFTFLSYPILLLFLLIYIFFQSKWIELLFPDWLIIISIVNFTLGNLIMIYTNMIAIFKRQSYSLIIYALANPVYWLMHSISAYKGLHQLITKPFYWEKTNHGLTKKKN